VRRALAILACIATAALPSAAYAADPVLFAAGDIACDPADPSFNGGLGSEGACRQQATADLMVAGTFDAVLALGDLQYDSATVTNFQRSYDLSWGRVKPQTYPVIGNHEGTTATSGSGYCTYFGAAAHCNPSGRQGGAAFYSFDLGTWHVVVLNSNCARVSCDPGGPQEQWLRADLAAHPAACTLGLMHHPLVASGEGEEGATPAVRPLWQALYDANADLVLSGHDHSFERFTPMAPDGVADPVRGIRQIISGVGGKGTQSAVSIRPGSEIRNGTSLGVARVTLRPTGYDWQFVPDTVGGFTDSGSGGCH
jgi:hypothetical protein